MTGMKKLSFRSFKQLPLKKKIILAVILIALVVGALYALGVFKDKEVNEDGPEKKFYSQLTGVEVDEETSQESLLGVMVENHPDARPQSGLGSAGIVFETIAEGGITRYMALFQENMPTELGPIRSVRAYYLDWAMGFDASLAHVGGSADALELVEKRDAKSLSQFKYEEPYRRVNSREAPHNVYSTGADLRKLQKELGHKTSTMPEMPRSNDSPAQTPTIPKISVGFSTSDFAVEFHYQKETNSYARYLAGKPDTDNATKQPITVKNFIVIKLESRNISALGNGQAFIFKDGNIQTVNWKQSSFDERIKFTDEQGKEVALNRGNTWISAIPPTSSVSY